MYFLQVTVAIFISAAFMFANFQTCFCTRQERAFLLDGINLQVEIMVSSQ